MAAGDRYIDCNNMPYESIESLFKQLIRLDDDNNPYINTWASGLSPEDMIECGENRHWTDIFYQLVVYDDDNNLALATFES